VKTSEFNTIFNTRELVLYAIIIAYLGWMFVTGQDVGDLFDQSLVKVELLFMHFMNSPAYLMETFIDYPLKELYR